MALRTQSQPRLKRPQLRQTGMLAVLLVLAAVNFAWQLGSSSYYVDEVLSINTSMTPLSGLLGVAKALQLSPPGFYLFQHEWLYRTNDHLEWVARLPSLICGVALVGVIFWLARLICERYAVAVGATALAVLSPFLLQYSQLAQNYVFASLAVSVAVAAALSAERSPTHRTVWLLASLTAAVLALVLHYTAALIVGPLCVRTAITPQLGLRQRVTFVAVCAAVQAALIPFLVSQHDAYAGRSGVAGVADLSFTSASRVMAGPFAGRVDPLRAVGLAVVLISVLVLLVRVVRGRTSLGRRGSGFVVAVAFGEPLALLVLSAFGARVALGRYTAVAVPMLIVVVAMAAAALPPPAAVMLVLGALAASVLGLSDSHRASGFYADTRGVVRYVERTRQADDAVLTPDSPGLMLPLQYYADRQAAPPLPLAAFGSAEASTFLVQHRRLWVILYLTNRHLTRDRLARYEHELARRIGYRSLPPRIFDSVAPLAVTLWLPARQGPGAARAATR